MHYADCHVHLSDYRDPEETARFAKGIGLELLAVSIDRNTSQRSLEIARQHPQVVKAFVGVHPSEAAKTEDISWLPETLLGATGCGEVGLDPKYSPIAAGSRQAVVFEAMLDAAEKAGKPVQVHSRGAENACLQALSRHSPRGVLMHWFEGEESLRWLAD